MSLIGSLEDLSLGDILQIISLSQKSGVLLLTGETGEGRIVLREGLVCAAGLKGGPTDLHGVLVGGGFVSEDEFQRAGDEARERAVTVDEILVSRDVIARERIESLCREAVEQAVFTMFAWRTGDFSFDVRSESEPEDPDFSLSVGINAQYLAMESARVGDESGRRPAVGQTEPPSQELPDVDELSAHEMFGVSPDPEPSFDSAPELDLDPNETFDPEPVPEGDEATQSQMNSDVPEPVAEIHDAFAALEEEHSGSFREIELDEGVDEDEPADATDALAFATLDRVEEAAELEEAVLVEEDGVADAESIAFDDAAEAFEEVSSPLEAGAQVVADEATADAFSDAAPLDAEPAEPASARDSEIGEFEELSEASLQRPAARASAPGEAPGALSDPIVVIDSELLALEWVKEALASSFSRVHIFQRSELGLARIRQYLVRGETPVVLIAPDVPVERLSGIVDARDFVRRLKHQGRRMQILWLCDESTHAPAAFKQIDGLIERPSTKRLKALREDPEAEDPTAAKLVEVVGARVSSLSTSRDGEDLDGQGMSPGAMRRLKEVTGILNAGASRGEVLPLVIDFASESFSRVAMFMVREDQVVGIAQKGLDRAGGPDDAGLQSVVVGRDECGWFRHVFETRASAVCPPSDTGDQLLGETLGGEVAPEAYVGPILGSGEVVALLYADNLPSRETVGDTAALEVVLHHAGLALERAVLERALAQMESEGE